MDTSILNNDKYIDAYLAGTLTSEDKQVFEQELQTNKQLQTKVALYREIIKAIRLRRMRELTKQFEKDDRHRRLWNNILKWSVQTIAPIAIAACLFGFIVYMPQVRNIKQINSNSTLFADAVEEVQIAYTDLKGCEDVAETLLAVAELMQNSDFRQADKLLSMELKQHKSITPDDAQAWAEKEDMLYLQALCAIQQKQVYRSRALLTKVIGMHGIHEQKATELSDQIKQGR